MVTVITSKKQDNKLFWSEYYHWSTNTWHTIKQMKWKSGDHHNSKQRDCSNQYDRWHWGTTQRSKALWQL